MFKLLNAGFSRMKINKVFFVINIITIVLAISIVMNNISNKMLNEIDNLLFTYIYILGLFMAIFISLFIGNEYAYGTIRNKIIVGHTRKNIYLSNFIFSIVSGIIFETIYIIIVFVLGTFTIGSLEMSFSELILNIAEILFIIVAYASVYNLISLLTSDVTIATVICTLLFLIMYVIGSTMATTVNCSKYITETVVDENGNVEIINKELNPNYPSELKMNISKAIYYAIPTGSAIQIAGRYENTDEWILFFNLSIFIIMSNIIGIYLFNRKDLK